MLRTSWESLGGFGLRPRRARKIRGVLGKHRGARAPGSGYSARMTTILAPIDFSPVSARVVAHAGVLAKALQARVVLLAVMIQPIFLKEYAPPPESLARVTAGNEQAAQRQLAAFTRQLARKKIPARSLLLQGSPRRLILDQARTLRAAYVVMGSHGHTAFFELIGGSTTQGVLKRAPCPVLVVPSQAPARASRRTTTRS